jgi:lipid-A-disaccharide synthase
MVFFFGEFPAMTFKVFIIAGESSGDVLGADLIRSLVAICPDIELRGIGGEKMIEAGLPESFFPMDELSVMGIAEILPRIPKFMGLIRKTVVAIKGYNPDVVVTIDSPDFSFRVQKKLKQDGVECRKIHYVAPTVWAWRPARAQKISRFLDGLICLFPFETKYFEREGLSAVSVGHPMVTSGLLDGDGLKFRQAHDLSKDRIIIGLFCGSRRSELDMSIPVMRNILSGLRVRFPDLVAVIPTLPKWKDDLIREFSGFESVIVTSDRDEKFDAFKACDVAAVVSGTVALEVALAGIPHLLFYKMNKVTWEIIRRVVTTKYAHLGNILLNRRAYHEFIQEDMKEEDMISLLDRMLMNAECKTKSMSDSKILLECLQPNPNERASVLAATYISKK